MIKINQGRLFVRSNSCGVGIIGLLEVPREILGEQYHECIIGSGGLFMSSQGRCEDDYVKECGASGLFNALKFRSGASMTSDMQEFFVRRSTLPSSTPGLDWCLVVGARPNPLISISQDGLYELRADTALRSIELPPGFGDGMDLAGLLRETLWGPSGCYGVAHTMEVEHFPLWAQAERLRNKDPKFAEYMRRMSEYGEGPMYYTAAQKEEREALVSSVICAMHEEEDGPCERPRAN